MIASGTPPWLAPARAILGEDGLLTDPASLETYGRDWTKVYAPAPTAIAFPRSTDQVSALLRLAQTLHVPVVPSGGRTGLAGGAVAAHGELVLSLERMRKLHAVDPIARTVRVEAGAITQAVHQHTAAHGLNWPIDFAS